MDKVIRRRVKRLAGEVLTLFGILVLCLALLLPGWSAAQTPLSNTEVTEAQIAHLFTSQQPVLYYCQTGIYDDQWAEPERGAGDSGGVAMPVEQRR